MLMLTYSSRTRLSVDGFITGRNPGPGHGLGDAAVLHDWYSVRDVDAPVGGSSMDYLTCFLRDGDRVFLTCSTTGRGNEPVNGALGLLDMTPYGRARRGRTTPRAGP